ncbi:MAG: hypothetical protein Q8N26_13955 [Myxococcales bacterium]|nr:hypothetical protein [Myxococcales bacterium]
MPAYLWLARTSDGVVERGELEAADPASVEAQLVARGLTPSVVREKRFLDTQLAMPAWAVNVLWAGVVALVVARWAPAWTPVRLTTGPLAALAGLVTFAALSGIGHVRRRRRILADEAHAPHEPHD